MNKCKDNKCVEYIMINSDNNIDFNDENNSASYLCLNNGYDAIKN